MSGTKSYQGPPGALTAYQLTLAQTSSGAITVTDNLAQLSSGYYMWPSNQMSIPIQMLTFSTPIWPLPLPTNTTLDTSQITNWSPCSAPYVNSSPANQFPAGTEFGFAAGSQANNIQNGGGTFPCNTSPGSILFNGSSTVKIIPLSTTIGPTTFMFNPIPSNVTITPNDIVTMILPLTSGGLVHNWTFGLLNGTNSINQGSGQNPYQGLYTAWMNFPNPGAYTIQVSDYNYMGATFQTTINVTGYFSAGEEKENKPKYRRLIKRSDKK